MMILFIVIFVLVLFIGGRLLLSTSSKLELDSNSAILITGCDSGIGLALAKHLAGRCQIIATCLDTKSETSIDLERSGVIVLPLDHTASKAALEKSFRRITDELSSRRLHALVNNAGVCIFGEFDWLTSDQISQQLQVNLGCIPLTRALLAVIVRDGSRIVNVTSVNGKIVYPALAVYCSTKYAVEAFSDALSMELEKFSVKVIKVRPGDFTAVTQIMSKQWQHMSAMRACIETEHKTHHLPYLERCESSLKESLYSISSRDFSELFASFEEALFSREPRAEYDCGKHWYLLLVLFLRALPSRCRSLAMRKMFSFIERQ